MCAARSSTVAGSRKPLSGRKYLGDATDPHFIPASPIITRQSLTHDEEEELTRVCTLVLSGVPHSDEDDEEEDRLLDYIQNHGSAAQTKVDAPRNIPVVPKLSAALASESNARSQKRRCVNADTATPSVASKRDTIDRTNTSTPLTVLSETVGQTLGSRQNSGLRHESKPTKSRAVYGILEHPHAKSNHRETRRKTISATVPPPSQSRMAAEAPRGTMGKVGHISISRLEFNKSLPSLPHNDTAPPKERPITGLSRIFENMKKKPDNTPSAAVSQPPTEGVDRRQTMPVAPTPKKNVFKLAFLFDRKKTQHSTQMSGS